MGNQMETLKRHDESVHDENENALIQAREPAFAMTASGLKPRSIDEAWRFAQFLSASQFVPVTFQGKPEDCLIAIDMALRLNVAPLMLLQNTYVVKGKPGMEAKLVIALVNASGLFTDPLDYEIEGEDPKGKDYRVRAFAARSKTGKVIYGPWITWDIVTAEGWDKKDGSKWKTIPSLMFVYRAAAWFARQFCPEVMMGMHTTEELSDMELRREVESTALNGKSRSKFGFPRQKPIDEKPADDQDAPPVDDQDAPEADESATGDAEEATQQEPTDPDETVDVPLSTWLCDDGHAFPEPVDGACPECGSTAIEELEPAEA